LRCNTRIEEVFYVVRAVAIKRESVARTETPTEHLRLQSLCNILPDESRGTHAHFLLSQIRDYLNLEGQVPVFISPRTSLAQLYPQTLGSLFVASYDFQGYGGTPTREI
jgi:hypothetical protein